MISQYLSLVVCVIGFAVYLWAGPAKVQRIGEIFGAAGALAWLIQNGSHAVAIFK